MLATEIPNLNTSKCLSGWLETGREKGENRKGTLTIKDGVTLWEDSEDGIPEGWTVIRQ